MLRLNTTIPEDKNLHIAVSAKDTKKIRNNRVVLSDDKRDVYFDVVDMEHHGAMATLALVRTRKSELLPDPIKLERREKIIIEVTYRVISMGVPLVVLIGVDNLSAKWVAGMFLGLALITAALSDGRW